MASVPAQQSYHAPLQALEANATPLETHPSERVRRQTIVNFSEDHQPMPHDEAADDTSTSQAVTHHPISPNDVLNTPPISGPDVAQGASAILAQPAQSAQASSQLTPTVPPSAAVASSLNTNKNPETVLGKRRQSDASIAPNKRTKTDDLDTIPGADNNGFLCSTTDPQSKLDESTSHSDNNRPAPVSNDTSPRSVPERKQAASNVENATDDPQTQEVDNSRSPTDLPHTSPEREPRRPHGDTLRWPSDGNDLAAFRALQFIEDPERQENLARNHRVRTMQLGKDLLQTVFDQVSIRRFNAADGWTKSAADSRQQGSREVELIAEYPMPVLRGDPSPPSPRSVFWVPGPDDLMIMCKLCLGLIVMNDYNVKMMKTFTTKSGTDLRYLRSSGVFKYYYQVKRSPQEDHVTLERGVVDVFEFESFNVRGVDWDIDGPRLMETMATYQHPHGKPYRIVGQLKEGGYDEDLLIDLWKLNYEIGKSATRRAFRERREDPDWARRYRTVPQSYIGDDTVIAESRALPLADNASTVVGPNRPEVAIGARNHNGGRGANTAKAQRASELGSRYH